MKIKALLFCKKAKPNIVKGLDNKFYISNAFKNEGIDDYKLNGKIVIECDFEVDVLSNNNIYKDYLLEHNSELWENDILTKSCLTYDELNKYLSGNGYAIHIKNLKIFDKPRELGEYSKRIGNDFQVLGNAPRNMMGICELKYLIEDYILIPVSPKEMCRIANKEQTVLVRRNVLKEML